MNPGVFSVQRPRIVLSLIFIVIVGGIYAYTDLGRLEDPEFTIKQAVIVTLYPGASPEDVVKEVTNPIEDACQQMGQVDRVESQSIRGRSVVMVYIKDKYHKDRIPQVWDELRRKVNDVQPRLPLPVRGTSQVVDDFGDVYGIFLALTGKVSRYPSFAATQMPYDASCNWFLTSPKLSSLLNHRMLSFLRCRGCAWQN